MIRKLPRRKVPRNRRLTFQRVERRDLLTTVALDPIADNTLYEDSTGSLSNGAGDFLFAGRTVQLSEVDLRRGLMLFDLSSVPAGATINSVRVELSVTRSISGDMSMSLHRLDNSWGEGGSNAFAQEGAGADATAGDATWLHRSFPASQWTTAGGDFQANASATIPVGAVGRYTWSAPGLVGDVQSWLADPSSNHGWIVIGAEGTPGSAKQIASRENPVAANRPKLIIDFDAPSFDFGDAPAASQSGFTNSYPVLLADDGARHSASSLILGGSFDVESDGQPSVNALDDGADEDGIGLFSSILSANTATTASLSVTASGAGKVDAWIDFNRDGDWLDPGEQIFSSLDVLAGQNVLSYTVPASASAGYTGARIRLSGGGGLSPTGAAADGEVEDYFMQVLDAAESPGITVHLDPPLDNGASELLFQSGDLVVRSGQQTRFQAPGSAVDSLALIGSTQNDVVTVNFDNGFQVPAGEFVIVGDAGDNQLQVTGANGRLDFSSVIVEVFDFSTVTLSDGDRTEIVLDPDSINALVPTTKRIKVVADSGERVSVVDPASWRMTEPVVVGQQFQLTATHQSSGEVIQALVGTPWQNLVSKNDINNDGTVSPRDALAVINEIARGTFLVDQATLADPLDVPQWPGLYFDQSGDGRATPLDALRVINFLARQPAAASGEQVLAFLAQPVSGDGDVDGIDFDGHPLAVMPTPKLAVAGPNRNADSIASRTTFNKLDIDEVFAGDELADILQPLNWDL